MNTEQKIINAEVKDQKEFDELCDNANQQTLINYPSQDTPEFNVNEMVKNFKPVKRSRALRNMIDGMKKCIDDRGGKVSEKTKNMLSDMESKAKETV